MIVDVYRVWMVLLCALYWLSQEARATRSPSNRPSSIAPSSRPTSPTRTPSVRDTHTVTWIPDDIVFTTDQGSDTTRKVWMYNVSIISNRQVYPESMGHFRINIQSEVAPGRAVLATSQCLDIHTPITELRTALNRLTFYHFDSLSGYVSNMPGDLAIPVKSLFQVLVQRRYDPSTYNYLVLIKLISRKSSTALFSLSYDGCAPKPRGIGYWDDPLNWDSQSVPSADDYIRIAEGAGIVQLRGDVQVKSLLVSDGLIRGHSTDCMDGWSVDNRPGSRGIKCYKFFEEPTSFSQAEYTCNVLQGRSTLDRHLIHLRDRDELLLSLRLCRKSVSDSSTLDRGCWIGLTDRRGDGDFDWIQPLAVGSTSSSSSSTTDDDQWEGGSSSSSMFQDWRRFEPNNQSLSEGMPSPPEAGGERCASLVPWQEDPLIQEQGSWNDYSCTALKPFICQMFGSTSRHQLQVLQDVYLHGGAMEGGVLQTGAGSTSVLQFTVRRGGKILISSPTAFSSSTTIIDQLLLIDGSSCIIMQSQVQLLSGAFIGEPSHTGPSPSGIMYSSSSSSLNNHPMESVITMVNASLMVSPYCISSSLRPSSPCSNYNSSVLFNAKLDGSGLISIGTQSSLRLLQGGTLSGMQLDVRTASSHLDLDGHSSRLATYDAFEVQLSNRGPFVGEFYGSSGSSIAEEEANAHLLTVRGVYRLAVTVDHHQAGGGGGGMTQRTRCLPYNATEYEMKAALDALSLVSSRGGSSVRRYGSHLDKRFQFGYTYRIEFDSPSTSHFDDQQGGGGGGPLTLSFDCYGRNSTCGCADTKVVATDSTGMPLCPLGYHFSLIDPSACVIPPSIATDRLSQLSYMKSYGAGYIEVIAGVHRFPPRSSCQIIVVKEGIAVVAADRIDWLDLQVSGNARLIAAGTGWMAWDSSYLLYAPDWTQRRGLNSLLDVAPGFNMQVGSVLIQDTGSVLSSCPSSNMTWSSAVWSGGILGGRSTIYIEDTLTADGEGKQLRYGLLLFIQSTATMTWTSGNLSFADGADIIVEGKVVVDTSGTGTRVFAGMAQLLEAPSSDDDDDDDDDDAVAELLLQQAPGRSWHSYYGDELVPELRGGWYRNPLCGPRCLRTNHFIVKGVGNIIINSQSKVTFLLPLDLIDQSKLLIDKQVDINLASGGICGNRVNIQISSDTKLELSGGEMDMQALCTISGQGELLVSAGAHYLSFIIDAHITIQGGSMNWPSSNGIGKTITFNGGLLIQNTGSLIVEPFSTVIEVNSDVQLQDEALIQFPLIGIAAQASVFDEPDAPDPFKRGQLNARARMILDGGQLKGKADFTSFDTLYLDSSDKRINSLAKLVNMKLCLWGAGDLLFSDNGNFLNLGAVQMLYGVKDFAASVFYRGTELPVENGGDVFANNYHTWDTDNGALDYTQYIDERTRYVSKAPEGWTPSCQLQGNCPHGNFV